MQQTTLRRRAVAAIFLLAATLAAAQALPVRAQPAEPQELPKDEPELVSGDDRELVPEAEALAQEYGLGLDEAIERIKVQPQLGEVALELQEAFPEIFAGWWIDQEDGGRLVLAFTRAVDSSSLDIAANVSGGLPPGTHVVVRPYSQAELERAAHDFFLSNSVPGMSAGADVRTGEVVVEVPASAAAAVEAQARASRSGPPIVINEIPDQEAPSLTACTNRDFCTPYRGGISARLYTSSDNTTCSTGFAARNSSNAPYLLTAGHCVLLLGSADANVSHGGQFMGYIPTNGWLYRTNDDVDAARINISAGSASASPWIYQDSTAKSYQVRAVARPGQAGVGAQVCSSGETRDGSDCGFVQRTSACVSPANGRPQCNLLQMRSMCNQPGDSGGAMWGSYMAIALISVGQNSADSSTCNTWGSYAAYAENDLQVRISLSPS